jgi:hypothetical protein
MKSESQIKHEVAALIMQSLSGDATPADLQELNRLIQSDAALVPYVVDILSHEAALSWTIAQERCGAVRKDVAELIADSLQPELLALQPPRELTGNEATEKLSVLPSISPFRYLTLAACLLLAIGSILGSIITRAFFTSPNTELVLAEVAPPLSSPEYIARVVNATSCRWSSDAKFPVENNGVLRKGESLQLVEGIAEIRLEWREGYADLRIEGPAGLVLTADHGCSLSHGKLTVDVKTITPLARFSIDTPNGLVELSDESSAGIFVDGRDVSVHSFRGSEMALRPWSTASGSPVSISLNEGESITLIERADGKMDIERGKCFANFFASQISMYSDALTISKDYVREVRSRDPILYWRFENDLEQGNRVQNEVGERYAGTVFGSIQQRERNGNRFIEFGASSLIDSTLPRIEADEYFADEVKDNYSLEVWIKPNHYHLGSIVSFVDKEPVLGDTGLIESPHGLLLEIGGPRTTQTAIEQPGKIRFLHRSPPSGRLKGSTCFSSLSYEPRKWQHLVVVKEGPAMRIYLNGELTGSGEDATPLSNGLMLIVGQLDRWRGARMYVGQLDELAFYPVALGPEDVQNHFEIARSHDHQQEPLKKQIDLLQSRDDI